MAIARTARKWSFCPSTASGPLALVVAFLLTIIASQGAQAQTYNVLHNFIGQHDDLSRHTGLTLHKTGNLYAQVYRSVWSSDFGGLNNRSNLDLTLRPRDFRGSLLLDPGHAWMLHNGVGTGPLGATYDRSSSLSMMSNHSLPQVTSRPFAHPLTITNDTWLGHTGLWSLSTNWSSGIPTTNNNVQITNSGSVVTEDINGSINNLTISAHNSSVTEQRR